LTVLTLNPVLRLFTFWPWCAII